MKNIDLHIHTNCSDGLYSTKEVLDLAVQRKLDVIAIADHDTLDGYNEAIELLLDYNLKIISAVEISTNYKGYDVHLLAYDVNPVNKKLNNLLLSIQHGRFIRAKQIIKKLEDFDIFIDFKNVRKLTGSRDLIGRPHIARAILEAGYCSNKQEVFDKYISNDAPAYVAKPTPSPKKVIKTIKKAGGIPVIAHPFTIRNDTIIEELIHLGVMGLEVYYIKSSQETIDHYEAMACEHNLIRTGGSDFHGDDYDMEILGQFSVPEFVLEELETRVNCQMPRIKD
ncbi:PHP domain-containing protein [Candidatus Cloacimonadota bacterium]